MRTSRVIKWLELLGTCHLTWSEFIEQIVNDGLSICEADEVYRLLPTLACIVLFSPKGVVFPKTYIEQSGEVRCQKRFKDLFFVQELNTLLDGRLLTEKELLMPSMRSAEYAAIVECCPDGDFFGLVLTEALHSKMDEC